MICNPESAKLAKEVEENNAQILALMEQLEQSNEARDYSAMTDLMNQLEQLASDNRKTLKKLADSFNNPGGPGGIFIPPGLIV